MEIYVDKENMDFITACLDECDVFDYIADELQYKDKLKLKTVEELQNQKAIECLKEVKEALSQCSIFTAWATAIEYLDNKIKELEEDNEDN